HNRAAQVVQPDDADEHQDGAGHRVEHELYGCIDAALVAPDADEQSHRNEHHFPEKKKEKEVEREEDADNADFQQQQRDEELFYTLLNTLPGREHGNRREERGEDDEKQADAIDANVVTNGWAGDPGVVFLQLITLLIDGDLEEQKQREYKFDDR